MATIKRVNFDLAGFSADAQKVLVFFVEQYKEAQKTYGHRITGCGEETREYAGAMFYNFCGASFQAGLVKKTGLDLHTLIQLNKGELKGILSHKEYSNWSARKTGQTHQFWLSPKGETVVFQLVYEH